MSLAQKLKQARLDAGLSQRQLCAGEITRNMLSQIENGSAKPSMATLQYLAGRLGKPISYFLEETAVTSANQSVMADARSAWQASDLAAVEKALAAYKAPDPVFDFEAGFLRFLTKLRLAEQALSSHRLPFACQLLAEADQISSPYITEEYRRRHLLLWAQADPARLSDAEGLALDEALLVKAWAVLDTDAVRSAALLRACENRRTAAWNLAMGCAQMVQREFSLAAQCLQKAEAEFPAQALPRLETCYRELGDFEKAYTYACKQR